MCMCMCRCICIRKSKKNHIEMEGGSAISNKRCGDRNLHTFGTKLNLPLFEKSDSL